MAGNEGTDFTQENKDFFSKKTEEFGSMLKSTSADFHAFTMNVSSLAGVVNNTVKGMASAINPFDSQVFEDMDKYATSVQHSFGLSKARIDEFKQTIADAGPELTKLGISETQFSENLIGVMKGLGTAASVSKEAVIELSAAAQLIDGDVTTLAASFRNVGISVYDVGEQMKEVADYARSVGVSVKSVSDGVVDNLGKMNIYNFDNGVKGLAKMAATSERLGVSMQMVFDQAEKLMDPEKAIDMSAALQRLGVTSSGLLDPLRAMDMAQNDPEALQKEMVNLGKEFTTFNERTGKMEILPGAKRRMREVADAVGMTGEQFAAMALKSADFEMKLKQIKMPNFAGDEETKELIASMAQMKDGVATVQVRNAETGITTEKKVEELTPDDIKQLQRANEESSKSIEEIAMNQLDQTTQILNYLKSGEVSAKMAKATSPTLSKFYGTLSESYKDVAKGFSNVVGSTEDMRKNQEEIYKPLEDVIAGAVTGDKDRQNKALDELFTNFGAVTSRLEDNLMKQTEISQKSIMERVEKAYSQPIQVETKSDANVNFNLKVEGDNNTLKLTDTEVAQIKQKMLEDPAFAASLRKVVLDGIGPSSSNGGKNK